MNSVNKNAILSILLQNNEITGTIPEILADFDYIDINLAGNHIVNIPTQFCSLNGWIQGNVGDVGNCSGILCPQGTFNQFGRHSPGNPCLNCIHLEDVKFLGQRHCENFTSERGTLNNLFSATGGEFWSCVSGWGSEAPICSWCGIFCEDGDLQDTQGITSLQLDGYGLTGTFPSDVWTLPSLRSLSVQGNPQLQINFDGLENAADSLEFLYLSEVKMSSLTGLSRASNLKVLDITGNELKGKYWVVCYGTISTDLMTSLFLRDIS